jgi:hypothetical protein
MDMYAHTGHMPKITSHDYRKRSYAGVLDDGREFSTVSPALGIMLINVDGSTGFATGSEGSLRYEQGDQDLSHGDFEQVAAVFGALFGDVAERVALFGAGAVVSGAAPNVFEVAEQVPGAAWTVHIGDPYEFVYVLKVGDVYAATPTIYAS